MLIVTVYHIWVKKASPTERFRGLVRILVEIIGVGILVAMSEGETACYFLNLTFGFMKALDGLIEILQNDPIQLCKRDAFAFCQFLLVDGKQLFLITRGDDLDLVGIVQQIEKNGVFVGTVCKLCGLAKFSAENSASVTSRL